MNPKVSVIGILKFPPASLPGIRPHLLRLAEATRKADGCLAYDVAEDLFEPGLIRFSELWPDRESLEKHLQAPHIEPWITAAKELGLLESRFTAYGISGSWPV